MDLKSSTNIKKAVIENADVTVGIVFPGYGYERVSYALPTDNISYRRVYSIPVHRFIKKNNFYRNTPVLLPSTVDLIHTWNAIPVTSKPFLLSFENELPRYFGNINKWQYENGIKLLKKKNCKGILALSEIAAKQAKNYMKSLGHFDIASKISVFRGGVNIDAADKKKLKKAKTEKNDKSPLKLIFIGGDLFPKGFVPCFEAIEKLVNLGLHIQFTVIGRLKGPSATLNQFSPSPDEWQKRIQSAPWVRHLNILPNEQVLQELSDSDLLLFPSYDETLGWAVVEAGLLSVPAVVTNVFALPELVKDKKTGYVINLKLSKQNRWEGVWKSGDALQRSINDANSIIENGVKQAVLHAYNHAQLLIGMGESAHQHMNQLYDMSKAAATLESIYKKAVES